MLIFNHPLPQVVLPNLDKKVWITDNLDIGTAKHLTLV